MPKAPLYTVINPAEKPMFAPFGGRAEPIDAGRDKALPLTEDEAVALRALGFKVLDPEGKAVTKPAKAKAKD
jgi:hypothetical protein